MCHFQSPPRDSLGTGTASYDVEVIQDVVCSCPSIRKNRAETMRQIFMKLDKRAEEGAKSHPEEQIGIIFTLINTVRNGISLTKCSEAGGGDITHTG